MAKYYYYPGWHEPGSVMECMVNKKAYEALPKHLQKVVSYASRVANQDMLADFTAKNGQALNTLINKHKVNLRILPDPVLRSLHTLVDEAIQKEAGKHELTQKVYHSFNKFRHDVMQWHDISERAYLNMRKMVNQTT